MSSVDVHFLPVQHLPSDGIPDHDAAEVALHQGDTTGWPNGAASRDEVRASGQFRVLDVPAVVEQRALLAGADIPNADLPRVLHEAGQAASIGQEVGDGGAGLRADRAKEVPGGVPDKDAVVMGASRYILAASGDLDVEEISRRAVLHRPSPLQHPGGHTPHVERVVVVAGEQLRAARENFHEGDRRHGLPERSQQLNSLNIPHGGGVAVHDRNARDDPAAIREHLNHVVLPHTGHGDPAEQAA
mmetsp:Transcript_104706/g.303032  ORF Transcript_104706/g.303032 Transcript_104706/m.303032 type:complete len:244 (-) Transcript_104706:581-1312(-)